MKILTTSFVLTPIGDLQILQENDAIVLCEFSDRETRITHFLNKYYSSYKLETTQVSEPVSRAFHEYFAHNTMNALEHLPISPIGTAYQLKVWDYLRTIPSGATQSYGEMAKNMDSHPRAVGNANSRNNIAIIIPCHRVIGANGTLTGYAGGLDRKDWLLRHEGVRHTSPVAAR